MTTMQGTQWNDFHSIKHEHSCMILSVSNEEKEFISKKVKVNEYDKEIPQPHTAGTVR